MLRHTKRITIQIVDTLGLVRWRVRNLVIAGNILPLYMHNPSKEYVIRMTDCFRDWGIPILCLDDVIARVTGDNASDRHAGVWISFDDGWESSMEAMEYLASEEIPFTLFICTGEWHGLQIFAVGHEKYSKYESDCGNGSMTLSIVQLEELYKSGYASIGAHTHSHLKAGETDSVTYLADLDRSIIEIGSVLGSEPHAFSYPHGISNTEIREGLAKRGLLAAFTTTGGCITGQEDRYELPRIGVDQESWALTLWNIVLAR